jgi:hypothetical protein
LFVSTVLLSSAYRVAEIIERAIPISISRSNATGETAKTLEKFLHRGGYPGGYAGDEHPDNRDAYARVSHERDGAYPDHRADHAGNVNADDVRRVRVNVNVPLARAGAGAREARCNAEKPIPVRNAAARKGMVMFDTLRKSPRAHSRIFGSSRLPQSL